MKHWTLIVIIIVFSFSNKVIASSSICPDPPPLQEGADDFRMHERDFTLEEALESVSFLQTDFSKRIWGDNAVTDFSSWSGHYIGYHNSLKTIEGMLLKQQVLLEIARLNEVTATSSNSETIDQSKKKLKMARDHFCEFLNSAEYVD